MLKADVYRKKSSGNNSLYWHVTSKSFQAKIIIKKCLCATENGGIVSNCAALGGPNWTRSLFAPFFRCQVCLFFFFALKAFWEFEIKCQNVAIEGVNVTLKYQSKFNHKRPNFYKWGTLNCFSSRYYNFVI